MSDIDLSKYLNSDISKVCCGGESGSGARICRYDWVLHIRKQCEEHHKKFYFKQTGARFEKDGTVYMIPREQQGKQARKANIDLK